MAFHSPVRDNGGRAQDTGILAEFFLHPVHLTFKSEEEGRPIYEDREFVRILVAGDPKNEVVREASADDKARFREQYRAFREGQSDPAQSGTPLKAWPAMTPALIRMLNAQNIFTVEHLAGLSDNGMQAMGLGGREWSRKAQAYLAHAKDSAVATKLAAENESLRTEVDDLKRQVAELAAKAEQAAEGRVRARSR